MHIIWAVMMLSVSVMAQADFQVKMPPYKTYMRITATGINLRQGPGTQYPRLVEQPDDPYSDGYYEMMTVWTSQPLKKYQKAVRADGDVLPIVGESGEWVKLRLLWSNTVDETSLDVWTMKKFCTQITPRPVTPSEAATHDIYIIPSGKYQGICLGWTWMNEMGDNPDYLWLGRYVNGMVVFGYRVGVGRELTDETSVSIKPYPWDKEEVPYLHFPERLAKGSVYSIDLRRFASDDQAMVQLLSITRKGQRYRHNAAWYAVSGDKKLYYLSEF